MATAEFSMVDSLLTSLGIRTFRATAAAAKVLRGLGGARTARKFQKGRPKEAKPSAELEDVETLLEGLDGRKVAWAQTDAIKKAEYLEECLKRMVGKTDECAKITCEVKGAYESGQGEELAAWSSCCWFVSETVKSLRHDFKPPLGPVRTVKGEETFEVVETFPRGLLLSLVFLGMKGEVWVKPGKRVRQGAPRVNEKGSVWLVLGAGNQVPAVVGDIVHCMFMCNSTVILKMNPINDFLGPLLEDCFDPLIRRGYLKIVYGGAEVGKMLVNHRLTEEIHMTGSDKTFDAITWRGQKPKPGSKKQDPPFKKPVHAELGCVTPFIILPGNWSSEDLDFQAKQCVSGKLHNAGHNCVALEVLVVPENWHLREKFMARVEHHLERSQKRIAWYPHSKANYDRFVSQFPHAKKFGSFDESTGQCPWVLASGLTPETASSSQENWCGVLQEVRIKSKNLNDYVEQVADFCNNKLWGDLSCAVFVDPKTQKHSKRELDHLLEKLRYGSISVNCPTTLVFAVPTLTWGAHPGNTVQDIRSGNACVHNTNCIQDHQKSVLYAPWKPPIYPVWNYDNVNLENSAKGMVNFFAFPTLPNFAALALQALFGTP
ncbi:aldehyde/histidinol dehydrogenase [Chloropicon primus]|uniref:Aldehyde/histidinol dehydrogenase n=1 Tax=Chloropicon primus TaxID=1764295 RepID=A0A5B8MCI1_9CHLO|nr:aldehyde/histidinol dehydrogenase [Chloropicon primus]UPQ97409.1 aldehyde/histidinol dehydrogenase [Chloropicon primus]|mmetsp:Transcript_8394/g.23997  ORF Transcript_8394/g.23997 Transcript_8394/m.23997 type:complete len:602 (+) Transcript_8394:199-2004(+)|eukprot:QDZ18197.1 aldehyde/histidinol dehydrogenase [Chloropicon primus]